MKDLLVLVADKTMNVVINQLLERNKSFGIRKISFDIYSHPHHDPGVLLEAGEFLASYNTHYDYSLVMFDRVGCGQKQKSVQELKDSVQNQLNNSGWEDRSGVIIIDPELEVWVWSDSPHVSKVLHIQYKELRAILNNSMIKKNPKEQMKEILRRSKIPWSSSLHQKIARNVSLKNCSDQAFCQMREYLLSWFGS